jgi:recombination protein RecT
MTNVDQPVQQASQAVAKKSAQEFFNSVSDQITKLTNEGGIELPQQYSVTNALKSAWLILSETVTKDNVPVLDACTRPSIINGLMKMVTQGLNPSKMQCYFIPYGNKLNFQRSYQGSIALAKRVANVKTVNANVIYKNDSYVTTIDPATGIKKLLSHDQKLANRNDAEIIGAYAIVVFNDGTSQLEEMTVQEIMKSWGQGQTKGNSPAHQNFKGEMSKKTVINRALKTLINSSTDSGLMDEDGDGSPIEDPKAKSAMESMDFDDHVEVVETKPAQESRPVTAANPTPVGELFDKVVPSSKNGTSVAADPGF